MLDQESFLKQEKCMQSQKDFEKLIKIFKQQADEAQKASAKCQKAVIFIGDTGSGKSTLVNWLNGAEFEFEEINGDAFLQMKEEQTQKCSKIGAGTQSVTLYPEYYYNENQQILTIDFPGFKDTRGWQEQLIIKMMYMDVVKRFDTKFVIVVQQPTIDLVNRGQSLQELVNTTFQPQDGAKFDSICFILNQFTQADKKPSLLTRMNTSLENMKRNAKDDSTKCVYEAFQKNIQIVEKIYSEEDYQRIFSDANRQKLWQEINATKPIQIQCKKLEYSGDIGEYLQIMSDKYLQEILDFLNNTWSCHVIATYDIQILKLMIDELNKIINEKVEFKYFQEIPNFLAKLCEVSNINNSKNLQKIQKSFKTFFELFEFFERYKEFILGYKSFQEYIQIIKNYFISHKQNFESQFGKLELQEKHKQEQARLQGENQKKEEENKKLLEESEKAKQEQIKMQSEVINQYSQQIDQTQQLIKEQAKMHQEQQEQIKQQYEQEREKKQQEQGEKEINMILRSIIEISYDWCKEKKNKLIGKAKYDQQQLQQYMNEINEIKNKNKLQCSIEAMKKYIMNQMEEEKKKEIQQQEQKEQEVERQNEKQRTKQKKKQEEEKEIERKNKEFEKQLKNLEKLQKDQDELNKRKEKELQEQKDKQIQEDKRDKQEQEDKKKEEARKEQEYQQQKQQLLQQQEQQQKQKQQEQANQKQELKLIIRGLLTDFQSKQEAYHKNHTNTYVNSLSTWYTQAESQEILLIKNQIEQNYNSVLLNEEERKQFKIEADKIYSKAKSLMK